MGNVRKTRKQILQAIGHTEDRAALERVTILDVKGVRFMVRAINPLDFMDQQMHPFWLTQDEGGKIAHDLKEKRAAKADPNNPEQAKKMLSQMVSAYRPVLLKGILWPTISDGEQEDCVSVDDLFVDMTVASKLYLAIFERSVKKKESVISFILKPLNWILSHSVMAYRRMSLQP